MFSLQEIKDLIQLVDQSTLQELEIEKDSERIMLRKTTQTEAKLNFPVSSRTYSVPEPQELQDSRVLSTEEHKLESRSLEKENLHTIVSPMVGTFYRASSPEQDPFVHIGDQVTEKTVIGILEAMKLMNPLEAEIKGEVVDILITNGQLVEFGQPLFLIKLE